MAVVTKKQPSIKPDIRKPNKTKVIAKYDVGFGNTLFIRGNGANLSWSKGLPMRNVKNDEWVWETELDLKNVEFKVLINDLYYEYGPNHVVTYSKSIQFSPKF